MDKCLVYSVDDPNLVPDPQASHNSSTKIFQLLINTFEWPTKHFHLLSDYYSAAGLVDVQNHRKRPPPTVFRAFYEHWYALNAQLLSILETKDAATAQEARRLLMQIRKDAQIDSVYSAHITKIVIGKKPSSTDCAELQ